MRIAIISIDDLDSYSFDSFTAIPLAELAIKLELFRGHIDSWIRSLLECCPNVENLEIDAYALSDTWIVAGKTPLDLQRLRGLALYEPKKAPYHRTDVSSLLSLATLGRLRELWTNDIRIFTHDSRIRDALGLNLRKLEFYGPHHPDLQTALDYEEAHSQLLNQLEHFPLLSSVDLTCCSRLGALMKPETATQLPTSVRYLRVNGCISYDFDDSTSKSFPISAYSRHSLQRVDLVCDHPFHFEDDVTSRAEQSKRFDELRQALASAGIDIVPDC